MTKHVQSPASDAAVTAPGIDPALWRRVGAGAVVGWLVGAAVTLLHASGASEGAMFLVEFEFLATGFAMIGAMFGLIAVSPDMRDGGEESARG